MKSKVKMVENEETTRKPRRKTRGIGSDILEGLRDNWWKLLVGAIASAGSFAGGVVYSDWKTKNSVVDVDVTSEEPPFETGVESGIETEL